MLDDRCSDVRVEVTALKEALRWAIPTRKLLDENHMLRLLDTRVMEYSGWHRLIARMSYWGRTEALLVDSLQENNLVNSMTDEFNFGSV